MMNLGFICFGVAAFFLIRFLVTREARELAVSVVFAGIGTVLVGWPWWAGAIGIVAGLLGIRISRSQLPTPPTPEAVRRRDRRVLVVAVLAALFMLGTNVAHAFSSDDNDKPVATKQVLNKTTPTTAPRDDACAPGTGTPADCLAQRVKATDGTPEEEAQEAVVVQMALAAQAVAKERSYAVDNTTCVSGCVLRDGIKGNTSQEMALELLSKGVMSPALLDDAAKYIQGEYGRDYTDTRAVGDLNKAADDLKIVFTFMDGSTATRGVIPKGTTRWNTVVQDGRVVQFQYVLKRDRVFIRFAKDGITLEFFDSCGNRTSAKPAPGVPEVPEPPHDDQPPPEKPTPTTSPPATTPGTTPPRRTCPPPAGVRPDQWDFVKCRKKDQSFDQQQNQSPARQDVQNNTTSGANTGPTSGAGPEPTRSPTGPRPQPNTPAPDPTPGGSDSGSGTGDNTPGGSTCDDGGCSGGGSQPPSGPPTEVDNGDHNSDPGGFD